MMKKEYFDLARDDVCSTMSVFAREESEPSVLVVDRPNICRVTGRVKWFDPAKGFGFVVSDDGGPDILVHVNVLRNFGQNSVAENARIEAMVQKTDRGLQATEILRLLPPERDDAQGLRDLSDIGDSELSELALEPGRVKWFDKAKGFGFANIFGKPEDVFLHIEVLRLSGLADVQPGEALALRVIDGQRGRMAAQVFPWEMGLPDALILE